PSPPPPEPAASSPLDASACGTIAGQVRWSGATPAVPSFTAHPYPWLPCVALPARDFPNPNRPRIDGRTSAVEEAGVFLGGGGPVRGRARDPPPLRVEVRDFQYTVHQGDCDGRFGFVRRGDTVKFLSRQQEYEVIRARGAAFFSLPFRDTY